MGKELTLAVFEDDREAFVQRAMSAIKMGIDKSEPGINRPYMYVDCPAKQEPCTENVCLLRGCRSEWLELEREFNANRATFLQHACDCGKEQNNE